MYRPSSPQSRKIGAASAATLLLLVLTVLPALAVAAEGDSVTQPVASTESAAVDAPADGTLSPPQQSETQPTDQTNPNPNPVPPTEPTPEEPPVVTPPEEPVIVDPEPQVPTEPTVPTDTSSQPTQPTAPVQTAQNSDTVAANLALTSATTIQADTGAAVVAAAESSNPLATFAQRVASVASAAQAQLNPLGLLGKIVSPLYKYGTEGLTPQTTLTFYAMAGTAGALGLALITGAIQPARLRRQLKPARQFSRDRL